MIHFKSGLYVCVRLLKNQRYFGGKPSKKHSVGFLQTMWISRRKINKKNKETR